VTTGNGIKAVAKIKQGVLFIDIQSDKKCDNSDVGRVGAGFVFQRINSRTKNGLAMPSPFEGKANPKISRRDLLRA